MLHNLSHVKDLLDCIEKRLHCNSRNQVSYGPRLCNAFVGRPFQADVPLPA
jgi:hypothetical protein